MSRVPSFEEVMKLPELRHEVFSLISVGKVGELIVMTKDEVKVLIEEMVGEVKPEEDIIGVESESLCEDLFELAVSLRGLGEAAMRACQGL